ncbi:MAG: D-amino acid dehydrogenase [Cyanobacteriota bacterium]|jgi:hypothetical protein
MKRRRLLQVAGFVLGGLFSGLISRGQAASRETRSIKPPNLSETNLGQKILCYRPMRRGGPKMSVESAGRQIVAHNYGHGGSGWTLAPGAATYVIDLMEEKSKGQNLLKSSPVAVVGAGVIGLFTAYELVQRGYSNITVIAEEFEDLTSHNAAGLLAPVSIDSTPAMKAVIDRVGIQAYQFYRSVAKGTQRDIRHGAKIVPAYFEDRAASGLEPYVGIVMPPAKDVILDFGNGTKRLMVAYDDSIFMDTAVLMKELRRFLDPVVTFEARKIASLADLSQDIVFDCAGMGSALLNGDSKMVSVQGHLVMLKYQIPQDLQYMVLIYLDSGKTESGQTVKRSFYLMPKALPGTPPDDVGVIGGTFVEGATSSTPNPSEFGIMVDGARRFYGV